MTETMLDKAAEALCARTEGRDDVWADLSVRDREEYKALARAALEAIRPRDFGDLPETVCQAAENAGAMSYKDAHEILAAMIDAILSQSQEGK